MEQCKSKEQRERPNEKQGGREADLVDDAERRKEETDQDCHETVDLKRILHIRISI